MVNVVVINNGDKMKSLIRNKLKKWLGIYYIIKRINALSDELNLMHNKIKTNRKVLMEITNDK